MLEAAVMHGQPRRLGQYRLRATFQLDANRQNV